MSTDFTSAIVTISSTAPLSQSHQHAVPKLKGEDPDDYDARTWRSKLNTRIIKGKETIVIPAAGFHQALMAAGKYSSKQIPGQGKKTWTAKFKSGIMMTSDLSLGVGPEAAIMHPVSVNSDGIRGSGKRVIRRFPTVPQWQSTFKVLILDPIITKEVFADMVETAGIFIGLGQYRPENGGSNGRFILDKLDWTDRRGVVGED